MKSLSTSVRTTNDAATGIKTVLYAPHPSLNFPATLTTLDLFTLYFRASRICLALEYT